MLCLTLLAAWSATAVWFSYSHGWTFYYGDAEAHWNIAREMSDSRAPGIQQAGTVWLPLPHLLLLPLATVDSWWQTGFAAALPAAVSFIVAGGFLFAAVRRVFDSTAAGAAATALFASNPNLLYLQSTPMTEPVFLACLLAVLYFTVRYRQTQGWGSVAGAGIACCLGALTRYEGWFLIPFVAGYLGFRAKGKRLAVLAVFSIMAAAGPAYWLAHNWWFAGDALQFYRGPYSPAAIQGATTYPGRGDWRLAALYFRTAVELCAGEGLWWIGVTGITAALVKRAFWPVALLAFSSVFYIWGIHSTAAPIYLPSLWPHTYYNTRYGLAALPLLAAAAGSWVAVMPRPARAASAILVTAAGMTYWVVHPRPENWITWKEASVNSEGRRGWVREAADFLGPRFVRGTGMVSSSGEFRAVSRSLGIPLQESLTVDDVVIYPAALARPDLFLWQEWALAMADDPVARAVRRAGTYGIRYRLEKIITVKDAPAIEIYRRLGGRNGSA